MDFTKINNAAEYLSALYDNRHKHLIIISACDNVGRYMPESIADLFIKLGCMDLHPGRALNGSFQFAYIAVIDKGKMCYEKLGKKDEATIEYNYNDIKIVSSKYNKELPRNTSIYYQGYDFASVERGFNILILEKKNPVDAVLLDFSEKEAVFSRPFSMSDIKEYEAFRKNYNGKEIPNLALHVPEYPYGETVVIRKINGDAQDCKINVLCSENGLTRYNYGTTTFLTSVMPKIDCNGNRYIFHGVARWRDKFIIGNDDIEKYKININELKEAVGCFALSIMGGGYNRIKRGLVWLSSVVLLQKQQFDSGFYFISVTAYDS